MKQEQNQKKAYTQAKVWATAEMQAPSFSGSEQENPTAKRSTANSRGIESLRFHRFHPWHLEPDPWRNGSGQMCHCLFVEHHKVAWHNRKLRKIQSCSEDTYSEANIPPRPEGHFKVVQKYRSIPKAMFLSKSIFFFFHRWINVDSLHGRSVLRKDWKGFTAAGENDNSGLLL